MKSITLALLSFFVATCIGASNFTVWDDPPQPPQTVGFISHHSALLVNDFDESLAFYTNVLGFRHIWTNTLDWFKIGYIAYPKGGMNSTGYQTGQEMFREQTNRDGIIELIWYQNNTNINNSRALSFSHVGFIVPDTYEAGKYLDTFGVEWVKAPGQDLTMEGAAVFGVTDYDSPPDWLLAYFEPSYAMFKDPNGYIIEILPAGASY